MGFVSLFWSCWIGLLRSNLSGWFGQAGLAMLVHMVELVGSGQVGSSRLGLG